MLGFLPWAEAGTADAANPTIASRNAALALRIRKPPLASGGSWGSTFLRLNWTLGPVDCPLVPGPGQPCGALTGRGRCAQTLGHPHEVGHGGGLHLLHDLGPVGLDGALGGPDLSRDLLVELARDHLGEDLALAGAERLVARLQVPEPVGPSASLPVPRERRRDG